MSATAEFNLLPPPEKGELYSYLREQYELLRWLLYNLDEQNVHIEASQSTAVNASYNDEDEKTAATAETDVMSAEGLKGTGTESDPYIIDTPGSLVLFAASVNSGKIDATAEKYVSLEADIDLGGIPVIIGNHEFYDNLHFNGNYHKISGYEYNDNEIEYVALFQMVRNSEIKNLILDVKISCYAGAALIFEGHNTTVKNCMVSGSVYGHYKSAAIAAAMYGGSIEGCINKCFLQSDNGFSAGICAEGYNTQVLSCINTGFIYGNCAGIVYKGGRNTSYGDSPLTIKNCIDIGTESIYNGSTNVYAPIFCYNLVSADVSVLNCYYPPRPYAYSGSGAESTAMKTEAFVNTLNAEKQDFVYNETINNGYPCLLWQENI